MTLTTLRCPKCDVWGDPKCINHQGPELKNHYSKLLLDSIIYLYLYTPNVIRNLRDKEQPVREDRHYAPGTTTFSYR